MMERGGVLVVRKPIGSTSFDCVAKVRRFTRVRRVGHCGTLDPFAEGVLPICIGRATGLVRYMEGYDKTYRVTVRFGSETDSQDRTGRRTGGREPSRPEIADWRKDGDQKLRTLVEGLTGNRMQTPPMYSALKVDGRPLYEYARKGVELERKPRAIRIFSSRLLDVSDTDGILRLVAEIRCSKGTYIRSLCEDLGRETGFGAHAEELVRTTCGPFRIESSIGLDELAEICAASGTNPMDALRASGRLLPLESAVVDLPSVVADEGSARRVVTGQDVPSETFVPSGDLPDLLAVGVAGLGLLAVCRRFDEEEGRKVYRAERVFADATGTERTDG